MTRAQHAGGSTGDQKTPVAGGDPGSQPDDAGDPVDEISVVVLATEATEAATKNDGPPSNIPERFGRYVLLERMGRGGMAEVFRAVIPGAEGFRRHVVLKRILPSRASAPTFVEMFVQEARISALLHHPNIVQVFDFGQVDGSYFLAMELLDGWEVGAINKALRATHAKMPIEVAVHIAHEVLLGLSYAHTLKVQGYRPHIVHRDVSPSNIMCLRAGGVKLLDFGVASASGGGALSPNASVSFCGKYSYSAPEYVLGQGQDARIDLFAAGVVLWEMLTGERLFREKSDKQTLAAVLGAPVAPPSSRRPAIPAEVDRIVMKALERDPHARYQSAASMAEDLEQVLSDRRYQSQMLPRLLNHLFGEASGDPDTVTAVEELIQSSSTIPPAPSSPRLRPVLSATPVLSFMRGSMAALLILVAAAAMFSFVLHRGSRPGDRTRVTIQSPRPSPVVPEIRPIPAAPRKGHAVTVAVPIWAPAPAPAPGPVDPAAAAVAPSPRNPVSVTDAVVKHAGPGHASVTPVRRWTLAPPPAKRKPTGRRTHATAGEAGGLITIGRSIDPFAEAASRNPRK